MSDLLQDAADRLHHPMGKRLADDYLAHAAIRGHLGRSRWAGMKPPPAISLRSGVTQARKHRLRSGLPPEHEHRRWLLYRRWQRDQDGTPQCVAYCKKHWELSLPIAYRTGQTEAADYARAKQLDGYPSEEGTDAYAMLQVATEQGLVESSWWWTGPEDTPALNQWLLDVGPIWFGSYWSESMFRTDGEGMIEVTPPFLWGHEVLIIGYDAKKKEKEIVQSWGNDRYGIEGRAFLRDADFDLLMANGGDAVGVVEKAA